MTTSKTQPVNADGIIFVLSKLGYLDKLDQVALVFVTPRDLVQQFRRQNIIPLDPLTAQQNIRQTRGIGRQTASVLRRYEVDTIDQLKTNLELYLNGQIEMKNPKHQRTWNYGMTCWKKHGQALHHVLHNNSVIKNISQFVCSVGDVYS
ncbi:unnamed protein product [Phytophthora lilii]|uniref:Unnamed protein product n=1 Tax=Phytophthora lilii TaxID=2077276 RepID=A0A9W6TCJ0_9STRA|nr:unnamed protein product [Phytophthora lilii]